MLRRGEATMGRRLVAAVLPLTLCALMGLGVADYVIVRKRMFIEIQNSINAIAAQTAAALQSFFNQRENDLGTLSESPLYADWWKNTEYGLSREAQAYQDEISQYFTRFARRAGVYDGVLFLDAKGRPVVSTSRVKLEDYLRGAPPLLPELLEKGVYRSGVLALEGTRHRVYAKAVRDEEGALRGAVVLVCGLGYVERLLRDTHFTEKGAAFLVGEDGKAVLGVSPPLAQVLTGRSRLAGTPWEVVVEVDPREFLAPLQRLRDLSIFFSLITAFFSAALLIWGIRKATRPIEEMAEGTRRLAAGDLDHRFKEPDTAELKSLAGAFNEMAASLQARNVESARRIRQLTALREMETAVLGRLKPDEILRITLQAAVEGLGFERGILYWVDGGHIVGRLAYKTVEPGVTTGVVQRRRIPLGGSDILNEVIRTRRAELVADPANDPRLNPDFVSETGTRGFILAPISTKDGVLGIIAADFSPGSRGVTAEDKDNLTLFANAAGLALENFNLLDRVTESENRHRQVLDGAGEAIIGLDRELRVVTWNRGAERIFGTHTAVARGQALRELFPAALREAVAGLIAQSQAGVPPAPESAGTAGLLPLQAGSPSGELAVERVELAGKAKDLALSCNATAGGGWSLVLRDETEKKQLAAQLMHSEKLSVAGSLISNVTHELNNPLATVIGTAKHLKRGRLDADGKEDLRQILQNAQRCQRIIQNLLLFVRKEKPERARVSPRAVINQALDLLQFRLKKEAALKVIVQVPAGLAVLSDPHQLEQIAVNLVNNACDALAGSGAPRFIVIRGEQEGERVKLFFEDSGPGVPEELREQIFESFFTTKGAGEGTGLGLAICRQIARDHGGELTCRASKEGGAAFVVELPAAAPAKRAPARRRPASKSASPRARSLDILVADDEPGLLKLVTEALQRSGHKVTQASSFGQAKRLLKEQAFDLVVSDVRLGDGSGLDLYDKAPEPRPAFLMTSGSPDDAALASALKRRGLACLGKPFEMSELRRALARAVSLGPSRKTSS